MKSSLALYYRTTAFVAILMVFMQMPSGCSGCSQSGRRVHQKEMQTARNTTPNNRQRSKSETVNNYKSTKNSLTLNELYDKYKESVFLVYTSNGTSDYQGTGFFVSESGLAVSNYHVFEGTYQGLEVIETLSGERFRVLEVKEKSQENDYIIFNVDIGDYYVKYPLSISEVDPKIGEDVFSIGNPRGLESTLSKGIVSALRADNSIIQTTTEITHGSSGGPLLNMNGEVIGITSAGLGEANLNFAINIKELKLYRYK